MRRARWFMRARGREEEWTLVGGRGAPGVGGGPDRDGIWRGDLELSERGSRGRWSTRGRAQAVPGAAAALRAPFAGRGAPRHARRLRPPAELRSLPLLRHLPRACGDGCPGFASHARVRGHAG